MRHFFRRRQIVNQTELTNHLADGPGVLRTKGDICMLGAAGEQDKNIGIVRQ